MQPQLMARHASESEGFRTIDREPVADNRPVNVEKDLRKLQMKRHLRLNAIDDTGRCRGTSSFAKSGRRSLEESAAAVVVEYEGVER